MPQLKCPEKTIPSTEHERKILHAIMLLDRQRSVSPTSNEIADYLGFHQGSTGNTLRRMIEKKLVLQNTKKALFINWRLIAERSFVYMFDAEGCNEYDAHYGLQVKTFYARNMWEAGRFASALGEPDYIQRNKMPCLQKKDTSSVKK